MKPQTEKVVLEASVRLISTKGALTTARAQGLVPAVVYKEGESAVSIQVAAKEISRVLHSKAGENALITLKFDAESKPALKGHASLSGGESVVLIKELQHHPVTHQLLHVDFHQVSLTKRITVSVPVSVKGEAIGVKQFGGVLEHLRWEVEVSCLPTEIPAEIAVDITDLGLGKTLHVSDLKLPEGVTVTTDSHQPIVACIEPKAEVVAAEAEAPAATEPEVLKQKKPEEGAAAAEGDAAKKGGEAKPKAEAKK